MPGHYLMLSKFKLIFIIILLTIPVSGQIENLKWKKINISYEKPDEFVKRNYSFESDNLGDLFKKSLVNIYWFFISDVDGDNCSFKPTCSEFFINSIDETNIFQATLMLSDRLTRDTDPFKMNRYPMDQGGHFYDPANNYTLNTVKINFLPPTFIADDE